MSDISKLNDALDELDLQKRKCAALRLNNDELKDEVKRIRAERDAYRDGLTAEAQRKDALYQRCAEWERRTRWLLTEARRWQKAYWNLDFQTSASWDTLPFDDGRGMDVQAPEGSVIRAGFSGTVESGGPE